VGRVFGSIVVAEGVETVTTSTPRAVVSISSGDQNGQGIRAHSGGGRFRNDGPGGAENWRCVILAQAS